MGAHHAKRRAKENRSAQLQTAPSRPTTPRSHSVPYAELCSQVNKVIRCTPAESPVFDLVPKSRWLHPDYLRSEHRCRNCGGHPEFGEFLHKASECDYDPHGDATGQPRPPSPTWSERSVSSSASQRRPASARSRSSSSS